MTRAFVFPGQGSQAIGMGKDLFDSFQSAKLVFEEIDDALNQKLSQLMFAGDVQDLNMTENTQPALMAVSVATTTVLAKEFGVNIADHAKFVAGHSLGEYSALTAVGSFGIADCARLLKARGQAMQNAVPVGQGSMAAILGLEMDTVQNIANEAAQVTGAVCSAANDNSPGQVVISGSTAAIEKAVALATEQGAKRSVILPVSAPFHCSLMEPAANVMEEKLAETTIAIPAVPVISNVTAEAVTNPDDIRRLLVEQVTGMVRWCDSVQYMVDQGCDEFVETGVGKVLTGLNRRITKESKAVTLNTIENIEAFAKELV